MMNLFTSSCSSSNSEGHKQLVKMKPNHDDPISMKELFIHAKVLP